MTGPIGAKNGLFQRLTPEERALKKEARAEAKALKKAEKEATPSSAETRLDPDDIYRSGKVENLIDQSFSEASQLSKQHQFNITQTSLSSPQGLVGIVASAALGPDLQKQVPDIPDEANQYLPFLDNWSTWATQQAQGLEQSQTLSHTPEGGEPEKEDDYIQVKQGEIGLALNQEQEGEVQAKGSLQLDKQQINTQITNKEGVTLKQSADIDDLVFSHGVDLGEDKAKAQSSADIKQQKYSAQVTAASGESLGAHTDINDQVMGFQFDGGKTDDNTAKAKAGGEVDLNDRHVTGTYSNKDADFTSSGSVGLEGGLQTELKLGFKQDDDPNDVTQQAIQLKAGRKTGASFSTEHIVKTTGETPETTTTGFNVGAFYDTETQRIETSGGLKNTAQVGVATGGHQGTTVNVSLKENVMGDLHSASANVSVKPGDVTTDLGLSGYKAKVGVKGSGLEVSLDAPLKMGEGINGLQVMSPKENIDNLGDGVKALKIGMGFKVSRSNDALTQKDVQVETSQGKIPMHRVAIKDDNQWGGHVSYTEKGVTGRLDFEKTNTQTYAHTAPTDQRPAYTEATELEEQYETLETEKKTLQGEVKAAKKDLQALKTEKKYYQERKLLSPEMIKRKTAEFEAQKTELETQIASQNDTLEQLQSQLSEQSEGVTAEQVTQAQNDLTTQQEALETLKKDHQLLIEHKDKKLTAQGRKLKIAEVNAAIEEQESKIAALQSPQAKAERETKISQIESKQADLKPQLEAVYEAQEAYAESMNPWIEGFLEPEAGFEKAAVLAEGESVEIARTREIGTAASVGAGANLLKSPAKLDVAEAKVEREKEIEQKLKLTGLGDGKVKVNLGREVLKTWDVDLDGAHIVTGSQELQKGQSLDYELVLDLKTESGQQAYRDIVTSMDKFKTPLPEFEAETEGVEVLSKTLGGSLEKEHERGLDVSKQIQISTDKTQSYEHQTDLIQEDYAYRGTAIRTESQDGKRNPVIGKLMAKEKRFTGAEFELSKNEAGEQQADYHLKLTLEDEKVKHTEAQKYIDLIKASKGYADPNTSLKEVKVLNDKSAWNSTLDLSLSEDNLDAILGADHSKLVASAKKVDGVTRFDTHRFERQLTRKAEKATAEADEMGLEGEAKDAHIQAAKLRVTLGFVASQGEQALPLLQELTDQGIEVKESSYTRSGYKPNYHLSAQDQKSAESHLKKLQSGQEIGRKDLKKAKAHQETLEQASQSLQLSLKAVESDPLLGADDKIKAKEALLAKLAEVDALHRAYQPLADLKPHAGYSAKKWSDTDTQALLAQTTPLERAQRKDLERVQQQLQTSLQALSRDPMVSEEKKQELALGLQSTLEAVTARLALE